MALKFLVNLYKLNLIVEEGHSYANSEKFLKRFEIGVLVYKRWFLIYLIVGIYS